MSKYNFDAIIFDLDGVITQTASIHSKAWKQMFDGYLKQREMENNEPFKEFTHNYDYLNYVDGKPRFKGVKSFLEARGIRIPYGNPTDSPQKETICGLGNKKNKIFNDLIAIEGVDVFPTTIKLIKELKDNNIFVGVASSSENCKGILDTAGLLHLFDTRVDGVISAKLGLKGKPEPDIFITACDNLGVSYDRSVVVEDAVSGVQAGENGHFGLVLGIARENNESELKNNGADIVITDLSEISISDIEEWFRDGLENDKWSLSYFDYNEKDERKWEALCTIGNGYFGTRGTIEEFEANGINYPGTYIAGVYNQLESHIAGRTVINEDFVNCPNWVHMTFKIGKEDWFSLKTFKIVNFSKKLDCRTGILYKKMQVKDHQDRETLIESSRLASMDNCHIAALRYNITPLNYSSKITLKSSLDGTIINKGVERYKDLSSKHLELVTQGGNKESRHIVVQTTQSKIKIAEASRLVIFNDKTLINPEITISSERDGRVDSFFTIAGNRGKKISINKFVAIYTTRDEDLKGKTTPLESAKKTIKRINSFEQIVKESADRWKMIWDRIDIKLDGDRLVQKLLRLHLFHLLITASPHNSEIDAGIPARGLHGEAYRGHIFWDTLFILPFYDIHFPQIAKSALLYRYRRLDKAREYAKAHGYEGAMFPWQSSLTGKEETPTYHLNPRSGEWDPDYSSLQRHVSLAVAQNIWYYYWITNDIQFLESNGAEIFFEICRFWASKAKLREDNRYEIGNVMGPDEFHEMLPNSKDEGLKDNFYTNIMVVWLLKKSFDVLRVLSEEIKVKLIDKLNLRNTELEKWKKITKNLNLVISAEGIFSQFDGYFNLEELDWEAYKEKYGNIQRLDRILKAEGRSPDEFKVAKQADVLMTFYNLEPLEIKKLIEELGYTIHDNFLEENFDYYMRRTFHGSTLSKVVHSYLLNLLERQELSYEFFMDALKSDYVDIQGGTTGEGIHTGVMAGTVLLALNSFAGLDLRSEIVSLTPHLPKTWRRISFNFDFKGSTYFFDVSNKRVKFKAISDIRKKILVKIGDKKITVDTSNTKKTAEWIVCKINSI